MEEQVDVVVLLLLVEEVGDLEGQYMNLKKLKTNNLLFL